MPVTIKKNEVFEFYQCLPQDVRAVVIEEMQPDDRCRFTRCSKPSQKEAKASKKFVYGLQFDSVSNKARIVVFTAAEIQKFGYVLEFTNERNIMKCQNIEQDKEFWQCELSSDVDVNQFAIQHFKDMLHEYQNIIKMLVVNTLEMEEFEVRSFRRLEKVGASYETLVSQILPKLRHPLKTLDINNKDDNSEIASCEEVYHVENSMFSWTTRFTNEQFLQLKASQLFINIGELSVENIYDFIRSWQNGKVRKNFEWCAWYLGGSTFNRNQLFNLFGVEFSTIVKSEVEIKNNEDPTKIALLTGYGTGLVSQILFVLKRN